MGIVENYHWIFFENDDPRVREWALMGTPVWPITLCLLYLFIVLWAGPKYMKNRTPYKLDTFIFYYNIYQVIACTALVYGITTNGWTTHYSWKCQPVDYTEKGLPMLNWMYFTALLKLSEFIETIVFVLRKKDRQISFLHVYHHVSTFLLAWVGAKFVGGGMATFPIIPNSIVHIVMYTYYLLSINKNESLQKVLNTIKPYITIMQMVQFCIIIAHALQALRPDCHVPKHLAWAFIPNVFLIFYLFYDFYTTNFIKPQVSSKKTKATKAS
ncbi:elongation of very long chain fatty acids protein AAEL008004 [Frankliniella occidentalis]|uniref:Elongation of very long chain fatty acids protein n=1 Tax=Frankliniella occidentalis TaxID=133901 RepID=A0A6J1T3L5_FRAOC|nr:elongation of very long chain fatty acids protein AAEL008004 [Frankliniella occidentalis]